LTASTLNPSRFASSSWSAGGSSTSDRITTSLHTALSAMPAMRATPVRQARTSA